MTSRASLNFFDFKNTVQQECVSGRGNSHRRIICGCVRSLFGKGVYKQDRNTESLEDGLSCMGMHRHKKPLPQSGFWLDKQRVLLDYFLILQICHSYTIFNNRNWEETEAWRNPMPWYWTSGCSRVRHISQDSDKSISKLLYQFIPPSAVSIKEEHNQKIKKAFSKKQLYSFNTVI